MQESAKIDRLSVTGLSRELSEQSHGCKVHLVLLLSRLVFRVATLNVMYHCAIILSHDEATATSD